MQDWLLANGLQLGTLVAVFILWGKVSRWSGVMETRITALEGWLKGHVERHPGSNQ